MLKESFKTAEQKHKADMLKFAKSEEQRLYELENVGEFSIGPFKKDADLNFSATPSKITTMTKQEMPEVEQDDTPPEDTSHIPEAEDIIPQDLPYPRARLDVMLAYSNEFDPNDKGNAQRFQKLFGDKFRYVEKRKKWYMYNGKKWALCEDNEAETAMNHAITAIKQEIRQARVRAKGHEKGTRRYAFVEAIEKHYRASCSAGKVPGALSLARLLPEMQMSYYDLDGPTSAYLFNTGNGTYDFQAGTLRPFDREDMVGRGTEIIMGETSDCPKFLKFLDGVFLGKQDLVNYFLKVAGSAMLGIRKKNQEFYLFLGLEGSNGKSTLMDVLKAIFADYVATSQAYTWMAKTSYDSAKASPDIAELDNARLVLVSELPKDEAFNENLIKSWTGGDPIKGRFLNENLIDVRSCGTLILSSNHKPKIQLSDNSMWRRNKAVPFYAKFSNDSTNANDAGVTASANLGLLEELMEEAPQILRLLVEKCHEFMRDGIRDVPQAVTDCIKEYKESYDTVGQFVKEYCVRTDSKTVIETTEVYTAFKRWAMDHLGQTKPMQRKGFLESMARLGIKEGDPSKHHNARVMEGLVCNFPKPGELRF